MAYAGLSASGKGFFLVIPITYPKRHKEQFAAIHRDFSALGLVIDRAPKNVAFLRGTPECLTSKKWIRNLIIR